MLDFQGVDCNHFNTLVNSWISIQMYHSGWLNPDVSFGMVKPNWGHKAIAQIIAGSICDSDIYFDIFCGLQMGFQQLPGFQHLRTV